MKLPEQSLFQNYGGRTAWALALVTTLVATQVALSAPTTNVWVGGADNYNNPSAWNPASVPNSINIFADIGNGGTVSYAAGLTNALAGLWLGESAGSGTFMMSGGELDITNTASDGRVLLLGDSANSVAVFQMDGGVLNVVRKTSNYQQDAFQPGFASGSDGTFTLNNGFANFNCGIELGINGKGTLNVNGGTLIDSGWFGVGRGGSTGWGVFNLTGGTVYLLRNPSTDTALNGVSFTQGGTNGAVTITGGTLYAPAIRFGTGSPSQDWETLNISGGDIYLCGWGVVSNNYAGKHSVSINVSGGTFHSVNMLPNTGGTLGLSTISTGGTNWSWDANLPINLTNAPGLGTVTFVPEATRTFTLNAPMSGPGRLVVNGPGTVALGGANTYTGGTTLSQGALQFNSGASVPDPTLTIPSGAAIVLNQGGAQAFANNTTGAGNVVVTANVVTTGTLGHSGLTVVNAGTLAVGGALNNSSTVMVTNTGALAGVGPINVPVTLTSTNGASSVRLYMGTSPLNVPGTLTINNNLNLGAGSELDVKLGTANTTGGGVNDLLVVNGNLTIDPTAVLNIIPLQQLTPGTYVIATYTGNLQGTFAAAVGGLTRYTFSVDYGTPGQIKLNVSGSNASLVWVGTNAPVQWTVLGGANWLNGSTATTFYEGDAVTFDDSASNCTLQIATTLYPASITFNNTYSNYSITGTGSGHISGSTGITKNGTGTVLMPAGLGGGNDFTGPVVINAGVFKMNGALSLGSTNGGTTVNAGGTLDLNGQTPDGEPFVLQGAGWGGTNGAINNTGAQLNLSAGPRRITLAGDTTFNTSSNRWDVGINSLGAGDGYFHGNGYALTKVGTKDLWMHEVGDTGLGDVLIKEGTLGFEFTIGMGDPTKTIFVYSNAMLGLWQVPTTLSKNVAMTNATVYNNGGTGTSNVLSGTVTLTGTNTINTAGAANALDLFGSLRGPGGFQKTGTGPLYLEAANTYTGPTLLNQGTIVLRGAGAIANSSPINLASGTVLDSSQATAGLTLGTGQTLTGAGSVAGSVTAGTGATLAPGTSVAANTLSISNTLTLNNNSTNIIKLSADALTVGSGVNDLVLVGDSLVLNGTCYLEIVPIGTLDGNNAYTVLQYNTGPNGTGSLSGSGHLVAFCSNPRYNVTVDTSSVPGSVRVSISGSAAPLLWKGDVAGSQTLWDHTTTNWLNTSTSQRDKFLNGDVAGFDDTAVSSLVTLNNNTITAGLIGMTNNAKDYTFTGGFLTAGLLDLEGSRALILSMTNAPVFSSIVTKRGALVFNLQGVPTYTNTAPITDNGDSAASIIQGGTNTVILSADNTYLTATILVTNGVLRYTNATALGQTDLAYPLYATNNGTLDLAGVNPTAKHVSIAGAGFNGQGAVIDSKGLSSANGLQFLTLVGDATIGAPGSVRWDFSYPDKGNYCQITGNGYKLTKVGTGTIIIYDQYYGDTGLGDIDIVAGRLGFQLNNPSGGSDTVGLGDATKSLIVESNAVLTFYNVTNGVMDKHLVLHGGNGSPATSMACFDSGGTAVTTNAFVGPVALIGTNNLFGVRVPLSLSGAISGSGGFVVGTSPVGNASSTLYLSGNNSYSGPTIISNNFNLVVAAGSSLGNSSFIQVNSGANLDVSALSALSLGNGQTLLGAGTNLGNVVLNSGATLSPGFPNTSTYALTITGNLTFQPGSTNLVVVKKGTTVANDTVVGLASVALGGTLVINNVGNALADGDAIRLFSATSYTGSGFTGIIPATPGSGLAWDTSTLLNDGTLRVLRNGPPTNPTNLVYAVSGNQVTLSWPSDYTGWTLQAQTNAPGVGITTTWYDVPGSATTNKVILGIDPTKGSVFYRMVLH